MALKIGGRIVDGPKTTVLVLPRQEGDIPFKFIAVSNDDDFNKLCPQPVPPRSMKTGVGIVENVEDPGYKKRLEALGEKRQNWYFLQSIRPSEIEWQHVKYEDPESWYLWRKELEDAGFSIGERNAIFNAFLDTNVITQDMVDEARARFLASAALAQLDVRSFQLIEPENTESGVPANAGESVPQG